MATLTLMVGERERKLPKGVPHLRVVGGAGHRSPRPGEDNLVRLARLGRRVQRVVRSAPTATDLVRRLNRHLTGYGVKVVGVRFTPRELIRRFAADRVAQSEVRRAATSWQRRTQGTIEVPLRRGPQAFGFLVVSTHDLTPARVAVVEVVAEGITTAVDEMLLRADLEAAREAITEERACATAQQRILLSAFTQQGETLRAIAATARPDHRQLLPDFSPDLLQTLHLAELTMAWSAMAAQLVPFGSRTLQSSLRRLTRWIARTSHIDASVTVQSRLRPLAPDVQRALFAVAYDCLSVTRCLRWCSQIRVELRFEGEAVVLTVTDNGEDQRPVDEIGDEIRSVLAQVGGTLDVKKRRKGLAVTATVPQAHHHRRH